MTSQSDEGFTGLTRDDERAAQAEHDDAGSREREHVDAAEQRMRDMESAAAQGDTHARAQEAEGADATSEIPEVLSERPAGKADES